jgi:hypothetical protein
MITTSMLAPWTVDRKPAGKINLPLPQRRRTPDGTGIVLGALVGALISGIFALVALAAWRWFGG